MRHPSSRVDFYWGVLLCEPQRGDSWPPTGFGNSPDLKKFSHPQEDAMGFGPGISCRWGLSIVVQKNEYQFFSQDLGLFYISVKSRFSERVLIVGYFGIILCRGTSRRLGF